jgi:uncharacterized protein with GYD domain
MPRYLSLAKYTPEGFKGLVKEGVAGRRASVEQAMKALGGRIESFYFAFGDHDAVVISELPDNASIAALSLAIGATGLVSLKTVVLLSPDEMAEAMKKTVDYRGPGQ